MFNKPDFMCIGAQKSGTTSLYHILKKHNEVSLPPLKELHYFDELEESFSFNLWDRFTSNDFYHRWWRRTLYSSIKQIVKGKFYDFPWYMKFFFGNRDFQWYNALFQYKNLTGEFTPKYAVLEEKTVKQIASYFPNLKIIFIMRDPVERTLSQYRMNLKKKNYKNFNPDGIINKIIYEDNKFSLYSNTINTWSKYFPEENLLFSFYDKLKDNPAQYYEEIFDFLEIKNIYEQSDYQKIYNKGVISNSEVKHYKNLLLKKYKTEIEKLSIIFQNRNPNYPLNWYKKYYC